MNATMNESIIVHSLKFYSDLDGPNSHPAVGAPKDQAWQDRVYRPSSSTAAEPIKLMHCVMVGNFKAGEGKKKKRLQYRRKVHLSE